MEKTRTLIDAYKALSHAVGGFSSNQKNSIVQFCIDNMTKNGDFENDGQRDDAIKIIENSIGCVLK